MTKRRAQLTAWQRRCLYELRAASNSHRELIPTVGADSLDRESSVLYVPFTIQTTAFVRRDGGLPLRDTEEVQLAIEPDGERPPHVFVDHYRFLGHPHVLSGYYLCLYLDPSREWDPTYGLTSHPNGVLNRLWRWLERASSNQFDADEALYHAVGGLPQIGRRPSPLPPIVVRALAHHGGRAAANWLAPRSDWCLELYPKRVSDERGSSAHVPVFYTDRDLPSGAGHTALRDLLARLDFDASRIGAKAALDVDGAAAFGPRARSVSCLEPQTPLPGFVRLPQYDSAQSSVFLAILCASARRKASGESQQFILAVPHPSGGPEHLLAAHIEGGAADVLREISHNAESQNRGVLPNDLPSDLEIFWTHVSDERPALNTRRDHSRPAARFLGTSVVVLGLGGLGSWIAEFVVRAGVAKLILCDPGMVSGGLLVRQDYEDGDIGGRKSERLAARLLRVSPQTNFEIWHDISEDKLRGVLGEADLIIDATVSKTVARAVSEAFAAKEGTTAVVAQVATDARSGSLGMILMHGGIPHHDLLETDRMAGIAVLDDPALEPYGVFWRDPETGDEFVPTRGCSIPTFHGSAADMAGVASTMTTLIASHIGDDSSGLHLFALPHTGVRPAHHYAPMDTTPLPAP